MKNYFKKKSFKYKEILYPNIPYIILFIILFVFHLIIPTYSGDYQYFSNSLNGDYTQIFNFLLIRYFSWTSRVLIEFFLVTLAMLPGIVWQIFDSLILVGIAYLMSKLFLYFVKLELYRDIEYSVKEIKENLFTNAFKYNLFSCFIILFAIIGSFIALGSAGLMATSVNYTWALFFGMLHFYLIIEYFFKHENATIGLINRISLSKKIFIYFILIFSLLYSASNEIMLCMLFGTYILAIIYCRLKKINIPKIIYYMLIIIVANFAFILLSPGNSVRNISEVRRWFPTYNRLNIIDKTLMGITTLLNDVIVSHSIPALLFSLVIGVYTYFVSNKKKIINTIIAFIPLLIFGGFSIMSLLGLSSIVDLVKGGVTQYGLLYADLNTILICSILYLVIIISVLFSLFVIYKNKRKTISYVLFSLLLLSLGSVTIMGFSPTVWASAGRWFIYYNFLITFASFLMIVDLYLTDSLKKLMCFISFIPIPLSLLLYKLTFKSFIKSLKIVKKTLPKIGNSHTPKSIMNPIVHKYMPILYKVMIMSFLYLVLIVGMLLNVFYLYKYKFKKPVYRVILVLIIIFIFFIGILPPIWYYKTNWFIYCTFILILNIILFVINYRNRKNRRNDEL